MTRSVLVMVAALAGCGPTPAPAAPAPRSAPSGTAPAATAAPTATAASVATGRPITAADIHFMTGMIGHHAQAVKIAGWAASHGASSSIQTLAARIIVSQNDEIRFMQNWLRDHGQPVPAVDTAHAHMAMPGMDHGEMMPGMLTAEQLAQLDAARGKEFDRLFLTFMMQHHRGAITMVNQLIESPGAAQDDLVFKFISDVNADQTTEIDRMATMLLTLPD
jgi:uncharacterized protein (DUF305 family)